MIEKIKEKFKKNSSTIIILSLTIGYLLITTFIGAGFSLNQNVQLADFSVSEDGTEIIVKPLVNTPAESLRKYTYFENDQAIFIDFIYSFGIGPLIFGEKEEFTIKVNENCRGVFFLREDGYELVLYKNDETGLWEVPKIESDQQN